MYLLLHLQCLPVVMVSVTTVVHIKICETGMWTAEKVTGSICC